MSELRKKHIATPLRRMGRMQKEDKENFVGKRARIDEDATVNKPVNLDENIRKKYEGQGAIPKRFGERNNTNYNTGNENALKMSINDSSVTCSPQKNIPLSSTFSSDLTLSKANKISKIKFNVFDEEISEILSKEAQNENVELDKVHVSSSVELGNEKVRVKDKHANADENEKKAIAEAYKKAKDFFVEKEIAVAINQKQSVKLMKKNPRGPLLGNIVKSRLQSTRVRFLMGENGVENEEFDGVTPHEVPPPQPEKVKLLHKQASNRSKENAPAVPSILTLRDQYDAEYYEDFIKSLEEKDKRRLFLPNYRDQNASTEKRQAVVLFIIHLGYHNALPSYLIYQTVRIFDDVLQAQLIPPQSLQLVMITALWLVLKKDYLVSRTPGAKKIANFSNGVYCKKDVLECEKYILMALRFDLSYQDPMSILSYCVISLKYADFISDQNYQMIYYFGGYMIDLALLDEELMKISTILLAAAAAELSTAITMEHEGVLYTAASFHSWRTAFIAERYSEKQIKHVRTLIIRRIIESCYHASDFHIIYKKYSRSRYGRVSSELIHKIQKFMPPME